MPAVQVRDHGLELVEVGPCKYGACGAKKRDRIITPVVAQAALDQVALVDEGLNRQESTAVMPRLCRYSSTCGERQRQKVPRSGPGMRWYAAS